MWHFLLNTNENVRVCFYLSTRLYCFDTGKVVYLIISIYFCQLKYIDCFMFSWYNAKSELLDLLFRLKKVVGNHARQSNHSIR